MKKKVLIVDDNEVNMDLMISVLNHFGFDLIPALNGPAGLAFAKAELPDLIVCDIYMPELDGYEVLRELKASPSTAGIPVIASTALALYETDYKLLAAGFDAHVNKPL